MNEIDFNSYIQKGGLSGILSSKEYDNFLAYQAPSWIDYFKKGKRRLNYYTNIGVLELVFQNNVLLTEYFEFDIAPEYVAVIQFSLNNDSFSPTNLTIEDISRITKCSSASVKKFDEESSAAIFKNLTAGFRKRKLNYLDFKHFFVTK